MATNGKIRQECRGENEKGMEKNSINLELLHYGVIWGT